MGKEERRILEEEIDGVFSSYKASNHSAYEKTRLDNGIRRIFEEKGYPCPVVKFDEQLLSVSADIPCEPYFTYRIHC
jgi:hypothetical protein